MSLSYLREKTEELELELKRETWEEIEAFQEFAESRGFEDLDEGKVIEAVLKGFFEGEWAIVREFQEWRERQGES